MHSLLSNLSTMWAHNPSALILLSAFGLFGVLAVLDKGQE